MNAPAPQSLMMSGNDFRESLRRLKPKVFVDGRRIENVVDERALQPGINAIALTYDIALKPEYAPIMTAVQHTSGKRVNRLSHINTSSGDLLNKLEATRLRLPGNRLRPALPRTRRAECAGPGHRQDRRRPAAAPNTTRSF